MLSVLRIKNFAIIDEVDVVLGPGLNVVTGETGAGKSILVSALHLVLGARARQDLVRSGAESAEVEALFVPGADIARQRLEALGLPADEEILVRRVVQPQGRSRALINGRLATASQLARLSAGLVDICSQHEHHTLVDPATHLAHLDRFGGLLAQRHCVEAAFRRASEAATALSDARRRLAERGERMELLRFQLAEIERVHPQPGEQERLEAELQRLAHLDRLWQAVTGAEQRLYSADDAVVGILDQVGHDLADAGRYDVALTELSQRVELLRTELEELARDLQHHGERLQAEPGRLDEVEERLHALRALGRRFGGSADAAVERAAALRDELAALEALEIELDERVAALAEAVDEARTHARALSAARHDRAEALGRGISAQLAGLGMGGARVEVEVSPVEGDDDDPLQVDGARLTASGIDRAEFLIAPNPGEPPRPLRRVASGGELSRALLALKCVLQGVDPGGLYVFDEVDTGVGGAVAEVIGQKLRHISRRHQVLCITHLPQIAAYADRHLRVDKEVENGRTRSRIVALSDAERREELARMLGGIEVSDASRRAAEALLDSAGSRVAP
ncbi:MAG: DNA repair protein RecN [Deltaproteobacteria bacterium]|nr:MAG: DNA repair protein RecN [Deltaproteobacteria bacterium]